MNSKKGLSNLRGTEKLYKIIIKKNKDTKHPEYTKTPVGEKRSVRPRRA